MNDSPLPSDLPPPSARSGTASAPISPAPAKPAPAFVQAPARAAKRAAEPAEFFAALGNPLRWQMVRMMATGEVFSATAVAEAVQREFDGVSKHLRVLLRARVIALRDHGDRRFAWYHIPEQVRRADGVLDYGFCVIRVD